MLMAQKLHGSNKAKASDIPSRSTDHNSGGKSGGVCDQRKDRIFVVFPAMEKIILLATVPIRQSEVRQIITIILRETSMSHY